MKPLRIEISAIGPYADKVKIDFTELGGQGVFLITGDTGAGKTTIFDAIAFALFGEASGSIRTVDTMRSDFAEASAKTYVELTFLHKGKTYIINRNPKYERPKKSGQGFTTESADAVLTMPANDIVTGYKDVTGKVIDILGINYRQFKQIAMIAQGEFLQLLLADSKERGEIFRKVFNTEFYLTVQRSLKDKEKQAYKHCSVMEHSILQYINSIILPETENTQKLKNLIVAASIHSAADISNELKVFIKEEKKNKDKFGKQSMELTKAQETLIQNIIKAAHTNELFGELEKVKNIKEDLIKGLPEHEEMKQKFTLGEKAFHRILPFEKDYHREKENLELLKENKEKLLVQLTNMSDQFSLAEKAYELEKKREPERETLLTDVDRIKNLLPQYDKAEAIEIKIKELEEKKKKFSLDIGRLEVEKKNLLIYKDRLRNDLDNLDDIDIKLNLCEQELKNQDNAIKKLEEIRKSLEGIINLHSCYLKMEAEFIGADQGYAKANSMLAKKESAFFREQAGILAKDLIEGEPCPVCGALSHPQKAVPQEDAPSEEELKKCRLETESARKVLQKTSEALAAMQAELKLATEQFWNSATEYYKNIKEDFKNCNICDINTGGQLLLKFEHTRETLLEQRNNNNETLQQLKKQLIKKQTFRKNLFEAEETMDKTEKNLLQLNAAYNENLSLLSAKLGELSSIKANIFYQSKEEATDHLKKWSDRLSNLKKAFHEAEENYHNLNKELTSLKTLLANIDENIKTGVEAEYKAKETYLIKLSDCGFNHIEDYHKALLTEEELGHLQKELESYQDLVKKTEQDMIRLEKETSGREVTDISLLEKQKEALEKEKATADAALEEIISRLGSNVNIEKALSHALVQSETLKKEYLQISLLSRTANGELAGKQKLAFEQYVQTAYFNQILLEANKRLRIMTNGRYELLRREDPQDLRSQTGLEINVLDNYTGRPRSVKSLSGGEAFKASLSLALGLSDVIQGYAGGVEINTLFIDEGFGALDGESLDQALQTLVSLTQGNRLVGIISHVSELKERIDKQIQIQKTNGGSHIRLLG